MKKPSDWLVAPVKCLGKMILQYCVENQLSCGNGSESLWLDYGITMIPPNNPAPSAFCGIVTRIGCTGINIYPPLIHMGYRKLWALCYRL
ncbi:hypothetical protein SAMN05421755_100232 [Nitrosomonas sp. Nm33]|nr:hypothetical protein SAMN05421755_100232 [Nitrosomonas sp. Nm33]